MQGGCIYLQVDTKLHKLRILPLPLLPRTLTITERPIRPRRNLRKFECLDERSYDPHIVAKTHLSPKWCIDSGRELGYTNQFPGRTVKGSGADLLVDTGGERTDVIVFEGGEEFGVVFWGEAHWGVEGD